MQSQPQKIAVYLIFDSLIYNSIFLADRYNYDCHDYVRIYLGAETYRKLCGRGYKLTSDFNIATVTFKSNGSIERSGFKIKFTSIKEKIYDYSLDDYSKCF